MAKPDLDLPIRSKHSTDAFRNGWERIFNNKKDSKRGRKEESKTKL